VSILSYKSTIAKWKEGNFSRIGSVIPYPKDLDNYAAKSYNDLKEEQLRLTKKLF
jgi:hypothetical protein